jgi:hypothetical protein
MRRTAVIVAIVAVTACGGGKPPAPASALTAQSIADKTGCTGYSTDTSFELYVQEGGECTVGDQTISVVVFADNTARDNYVMIAKSFGGQYGQGDRWVIHGDDRATVSTAVSAAGGKML